MALQVRPLPAEGADTGDCRGAQFALMRLLRPCDPSALRMVRLGRDCDGGYVVPLDVVATAEACLSYGVGDDTSFEEDLARSCPDVQVHLFDHSIARLPKPEPGFTFVRQGVCHADNDWIRNRQGRLKGIRVVERGIFLKRQWPYVGANRQGSITRHLRRLGLTGRPVVVKMDIEGDELEVIGGTPASVWQHVVCLVVELHDLHALETAKRASECLSHLGQTHVLVHLHGNNNRPLVQAACGLAYPEVVELTFVHRRFVPDPSPSTRQLPSDLDRPCQMGIPDLDLSFVSSPLLAAAPLDE